MAFEKTTTRELGSSISIGLAALLSALVGCNSPDATVGPGDGGTPTGSGGQGGGSGGEGGGQGGEGGAGGGQGGAGGGQGGAGGAGGGQGGSGGNPQSGPKPQWAKTIGSQSSYQYMEGLAIDALGDIYAAGRYESAVQFSDGQVLFPPMGGGEVDVFLTKFSPGGEYQWSKGFGGTDDEYPVGLATDGLKLVLLGHYFGIANFGAGALPDAGTSPNVFVAAFDPEGAIKWNKAFGSAGNQYAAGVGLDSMGNTYLTGSFEGQINFGGAALTSAGSDDVFLAKLDGAGGHLWSKRFGDGTGQEPFGLAVDPSSGGVVITGNYDGSNVDFGGGNLPPAVNSYSLFVASFAADGSHKWSKTYQQDSIVEPAAVAVAQDGSVYVGGNFAGALAFGSDALLSKDSNDIFIAKLDPSGAPLWARSFGNDKIQGVSGMAVDADGGIVFTGYSSGELDFGGGPLTPASTCGPGEFCHDIYVVKLGSDGSHIFSRRYGGVENDFGEDVAIDPKGGFVMTGLYSVEIDFGLGQPFMGNYGDMFVTKLK